MKYKFRTCMIAGLLSLFISEATAQKKAKLPSWVCENGYWVAESNINNPRQHTIWFYNNDNVLVGRKDLSGVKLKPDRRKTRLELKAALEQSLQAWATKETGTHPPVLTKK